MTTYNRMYSRSERAWFIWVMIAGRHVKTYGPFKDYKAGIVKAREMWKREQGK